MLRFIVVGGSIAGVSCAYALQEAGHQVMVLEQSDGRQKVCDHLRPFNRVMDGSYVESRRNTISTQYDAFAGSMGARTCCR
jgi:monoamine oxidase